MLKQTLVAALFAVNLSNAFFTMNVVDEDNEAGMPGAIQFFANVNSLNTFLGDVRAFLPYFVLNGKSINLNIDTKVAGVDIHIN